MSMVQGTDKQGLSYSTLPTIPGLEELATPSRLYLVDVVDSEVFEEATSRLMVEARVGLSCLGEAVGREGVLSLLVLATARDVFVFDLQLLGTEGFQYGLWAVLRRPELVKVGATLHPPPSMSENIGKRPPTTIFLSKMASHFFLAFLCIILNLNSKTPLI